MTRLPPDFKEFLRLLNSHEVEYLLVGGYAVNYYGYPRATADIDIWLNRTQANAERAAAAVREFGFSQATAVLFVEPDKVIRMGVPPLRIELLTSVSGLDFETCYPMCASVEIDGVPVHLIGLPDLKTNKKAVGRLKDLADLQELG